MNTKNKQAVRKGCRFTDIICMETATEGRALACILIIDKFMKYWCLLFRLQQKQNKKSAHTEFY